MTKPAICILNWLPIIINFSVIPDNQCSPILLLYLINIFNQVKGERNKLVVVFVVVVVGGSIYPRA